MEQIGFAVMFKDEDANQIIGMKLLF